MSEPRGLRSGHLLALAGAVLSLASLWAPWYRMHIPDALRNLVPGLGGLIPESVSGDAWTVFARTDALVALVSVLVIIAMLAAAGTFGPGVRVAGDAAARAASVAGAIAGIAVAWRMVDPPGPHAYLDVRWGAWACLLGCALMIAGGLMAARAPNEPLAVVFPPTPAVPDSVAPPG